MPEKFRVATINACKLNSTGYLHYIICECQVINLGIYINITLMQPVTTVDSVIQTCILRCWSLYNHKHFHITTEISKLLFCIITQSQVDISYIYGGHPPGAQVGKTKQSTEAIF